MTDNRNGVLEPGSEAVMLCDLFPGAIVPRPAGVPDSIKVRVIVTDKCLTVAWLAGRVGSEIVVGRFDQAITPDQAAGVSHLGGQVGEYAIMRGPGCSCGAAGLKTWQPYPDVQLVSANRFQESTVGAATYSRP